MGRFFPLTFAVAYHIHSKTVQHITFPFLAQKLLKHDSLIPKRNLQLTKVQEYSMIGRIDLLILYINAFPLSQDFYVSLIQRISPDTKSSTWLLFLCIFFY